MQMSKTINQALKLASALCVGVPLSLAPRSAVAQQSVTLPTPNGPMSFQAPPTSDGYKSGCFGTTPVPYTTPELCASSPSTLIYSGISGNGISAFLRCGWKLNAEGVPVPDDSFRDIANIDQADQVFKRIQYMDGKYLVYKSRLDNPAFLNVTAPTMLEAFNAQGKILASAVCAVGGDTDPLTSCQSIKPWAKLGVTLQTDQRTKDECDMYVNFWVNTGQIQANDYKPESRINWEKNINARIAQLLLLVPGSGSP